MGFPLLGPQLHEYLLDSTPTALMSLFVFFLTDYEEELGWLQASV